MALHQVAIVGRPNVGKSSMLNWLARKRISIVDPTPGVTRDRITTTIQLGERYVDITDTGGLGIEDRDMLTNEVENQIRLAIEKAHVVLFVVDARNGVVPLDELVAERLRHIGKPVVLVANKCDYSKLDEQVGEFFKLGFDEPIRVSAQQYRGEEELGEAILKHLPAADDAFDSTKTGDEPLKLAIVGRRNTGKSTFINALAQEERTIVSEVEGTTRDSVDVCFERDGKSIIAIDTAGLRYRGKIRDNIEFYSLARAERSIRRADVVMHFFDASKKVSLVDKQLASHVLEQYKPCIFVVNKWDLLKSDVATSEFADYLRRVFPSLDFVPVAFITAKEAKNVGSVLSLARNLYKQSLVRVGTGELNRVIQNALLAQSPPVRRNRMPKIFYATQVANQPPTVILFTNGEGMFDKTYERYLLKTLRDNFGFSDVPIKLYMRDKPPRDAKGDGDNKDEKGKTIRGSRAKSKKKDVGELWQDV